MKIVSVEEQIIRATIGALLAWGYGLGVNDGEETPVYFTDADAVFAAMKTTDEDFLLVYLPTCMNHTGWVRFVYGNEDHEVINDYTVNLEPVMSRIMALIDEYEDTKW